jgi:mRNA interferase HigB
VKRDYGARVDLAHGRHVFDIAGNKYRVVCSIDFLRHGVLILWVGTHADYDELNRQGGRKLRRL